MASSSCVKQSPLPEVRYEDVAANPNLFWSTLEKLHATMGTEFMIPVVGGRELDLHRLFVEVTSRGGAEKVTGSRKWREVAASFSFPSTATNASFMLSKYYGSLLYHYEQIYFLKAQASMQSPPVSCFSVQVPVLPSSEYQAAIQQQKTNSAEPCGAISQGSSVKGVIDGKFESGYLVTVSVGSENYKGMTPRRPREECEIKRRDPACPKPTRSGYNYFFAEQHARLKPLHPGKNLEISRMIADLWNNLKEPEKAIYQEKAWIDKESYAIEMEDYRERLRTGSVPPQQRVPEQDTKRVDIDLNTEATGGDSHSAGNESSSSETDSDDEIKLLGRN